MKAMILAAGKGTRVRPLTYELPKPMIPILGKPVLEYLIEHLARYGIREIMVNVSYLHERIEQYFGDGRRFGVNMGYSFEGTMVNGVVVPQPLGSAGGLRKIQDFSGFFDTTTVVLCGDAVIDLDLGSALSAHRRSGAQATLIVQEVKPEQVSNYGIVVTDDRDRITSFQEKPAPEQALSRWASTGIYIFEPPVLDLIPSGQTFDIGSDLFPLLVRHGLRFYAQKRSFNWIDIGKVSDYWAVLQQVMRGKVADFSIPGQQIRDGVWVGLNTRIDWTDTTICGPVYIGSGCEIEPGVTIIGPTWVGCGSRICAGSRVVRSILFDYTCVQPASEFEDMILCGNYAADRNGNTLHVGEARGRQQWRDARMADIGRTIFVRDAPVPALCAPAAAVRRSPARAAS